MAAQSLVSLRSEKTETPAGSRPEERDFCTSTSRQHCLAVSHPLPTSFIYVCVSARLRYGVLSVYCGLFLSLEGSVGNISAFFVPAVS